MFVQPFYYTILHSDKYILLPFREGDIFFPKIILLDSGDYTPQTDILTYSKGGYGGRGPHMGG
jgi:hypothetical protein